MSLVDEILGNHPDNVHTLLAQGADPNELDRYGYTPLIEAAIVNSVEIAGFLLAAGARVSDPDRMGGTALHWAAENNNLALAKLLLAKGADPNACMCYGQPVLVKPLLRHHYQMKELLYEHGADLNFAQDFINTKLLGHRFSLIGQAYITTPRNKFIEISLEGFILEFTLGVVQQSLIEFKNNFAAKNLKVFFNGFQAAIDALRIASNLLRYQQYSVKREKFQKEIDRLLSEEPLILPIGYEGHAVSLVRHHRLLAYCDRGERSLGWHTVVIYQIGRPKAFNRHFLNRLLFEPQNKATMAYGIEQYLELKPIAEIPLPPQVSGNCSWANIEAVIPTILLMVAMNQAGGRYTLDIPSLTKTAIEVFEEWQNWDKNRALHQCIQSFYESNAARKASKVALLGAILYQICQEGIPSDLDRVGRMVSILKEPQYAYVLQAYLKRYTGKKPTPAGHNLSDLLDLLGEGI